MLTLHSRLQFLIQTVGGIIYYQINLQERYIVILTYVCMCGYIYACMHTYKLKRVPLYIHTDSCLSAYTSISVEIFFIGVHTQ